MSVQIVVWKNVAVGVLNFQQGLRCIQENAPTFLSQSSNFNSSVIMKWNLIRGAKKGSVRVASI